MNYNKINNIIKYIFGIPKSIYVNFRLLPFRDAIGLPIIVSSKTKLHSLRGEVKLSKKRLGIIRIGFGNVPIVDYSNERTILNIEGTIYFHGKCKIGKASKISVGKNAILELGENFIISAKSTIICSKKITIGANCMFAWDSLIMDTDQHSIYDMQESIINEDKEITIGDKVWLGTRSIILKGSIIPNNSIIAGNTLITQKHYKEKTIIAGNPPRVIKEDVVWKD